MDKDNTSSNLKDVLTYSFACVILLKNINYLKKWFSYNGSGYMLVAAGYVFIKIMWSVCLCSRAYDWLILSIFWWPYNNLGKQIHFLSQKMIQKEEYYL